MTTLLLRVLARAGRSINNPFSMGGVYVVPQRGDQARDIRNIAQDMRVVGSRLKTTTERELQRYGK